MNETVSSEVAESETSIEEAVVVRPWVRYWARIFDVYLFAILLGFFIFSFLPDSAMEINDNLLGIVILFLWIFVESVLLVSFGNTPGKALLKTKIVRNDNLEVDFKSALTRSFNVWWREQLAADCYKFLHMYRQHSCRAMCKNS